MTTLLPKKVLQSPQSRHQHKLICHQGLLLDSASSLPDTSRCNHPGLEKSYCWVSPPFRGLHLLLLRDGAKTIAWLCSDRRSLFRLRLFLYRWNHSSWYSVFIFFFSKIIPSFFKRRSFSTSPSLLQGELHFSHQSSLSSGTRGCSWLRYSLRQSFGIVSGACALKGCRWVPTQQSCDCLSAGAS